MTLNSSVQSKYLNFEFKKHNLDIFRFISKKGHKFKKLIIQIWHINMFYGDLTKIIIVKYYQKYNYFWFFANQKLEFACIKLSMHFF